MNGFVIGYDPGGNGNHGVAWLRVQDGKSVDLDVCTCETAEAAIQWMARAGAPLGLGIDTLTAWSGGPGGWRPADLYLREEYPEVRLSVVAPNALRGAMVANGMLVIRTIVDAAPGLTVSEAHPKVLYYALTERTYNYERNHGEMDAAISDRLGLSVTTGDSNQWDALASAYAVLQGMRGRWTTDLHALPPEGDERLVHPCGLSHYYWP